MRTETTNTAEYKRSFLPNAGLVKLRSKRKPHAINCCSSGFYVQSKSLLLTAFFLTIIGVVGQIFSACVHEDYCPEYIPLSVAILGSATLQGTASVIAAYVGWRLDVKERARYASEHSDTVGMSRTTVSSPLSVESRGSFVYETAPWSQSDAENPTHD